MEEIVLIVDVDVRDDADYYCCYDQIIFLKATVLAIDDCY
jgi:hypothetical protein